MSQVFFLTGSSRGLGRQILPVAMAAARARAESDAAWRDLTVSTDRDDATGAQRDPLGAARA
jgi:hypothetical protein